MRLWCKLLSRDKILAQAEAQGDLEGPDGFDELLGELVKALDLSRPVVLPKHRREFERFGRVRFAPDSFLESVNFRFMEVENLDSAPKSEGSALEE